METSNSVREHILKGQVLMGLELEAFTLANYAANFKEFAAYYIDEEPTITELYRSLAELVFYCVNSALKAHFAQTAIISGADPDAEFALKQKKILGGIIRDVERGELKLDAMALAIDQSDGLYEMATMKEGDFSEYMRNNPAHWGEATNEQASNSSTKDD